jgi:spectrin beta
MIRDINSAWERLEKAEHERELALREELIRQEKLEQLAARYAHAQYFCRRLVKKKAARLSDNIK